MKMPPTYLSPAEGERASLFRAVGVSMITELVGDRQREMPHSRRLYAQEGADHGDYGSRRELSGRALADPELVGFFFTEGV